MPQPNVTIGKATSQVTPSTSPGVTFGKATGETQGPAAPQRVAAPRDNKIVLGDAITQVAPAAPTLTIVELTGTRRTIALRSRALPFRGSIKFVSEQRIDEGEYVGFPRINQTVLGAKENETEMNGEWHDRFISDPNGGFAMADVSRAIVDASLGDAIDVQVDGLRTARDLCDLFEDLVYSARPLRVTWLHLRRIGRMSKFEQDWQNPHDVKWKATFKWIGRDEQLGLPSPARSSLVGISDALNAGYTDLHEGTNFDDLTDLDPGFADEVDIGVGRIQRSILDIADNIETRIGSVTNSIDAIQRVATIATLIRDQTRDLIDLVDGIVSPAIVLVTTPNTVTPGATPDPELLADADPGAALAAAVQKRAAIRVARALRHIAARQRFKAVRSLDSDVLAIVVLKDQQDLRELARDWYGNPDEWEQIRKFNHFESSVQPAGTVAFIPTLRAP